MKKAKIVLYNPRSVFYTMPLALLAVGSALVDKKFDVQIIDGRLERDPFATVLKEAGAAVCLGITVLTGKPILDALELTRSVKESFPDLPVIWGGWHPSLFPTECLLESGADIAVLGQGELTFAEVIDALLDGRSLAAIDGIAYRSGAEVVLNAPRPLQAMDDLPPANYDLISVDQYFQRKGQRQLDYVASTGCHFRCAFCADPFVYQRNWTGISAERLGLEIEALWKQHQFHDLSFQDETFFTYRDRVVSIAEEFLRRGLRFTWTGTLRADQGDRLLDNELKLSKRSGLRRVMVGVESGSQEMLDWMEKDISVDQVLITAEKCVRHELAAIFPFIVGFPNENDESVKATMDLVRRLRRMSPEFETPIFYFKPYPGSKITTKLVAKGYRLPDSLEEWAEFDYVGSSGPWVNDAKYKKMERFKFYNRFAGGANTWIRKPLQLISRWRCDHEFFHFPVEKLIVDRLKPGPQLS